MKEYLELTKREIDGLPREKTLFVSSLSPIEVHGPHLPVGTDLIIAQEVMMRFVEDLVDYTVVHLPDLPLGAQPQPVEGSLPVGWRDLRMLVVRWGSKLRQMGFRYWIVFDNHGGFSHQMALAEASQRLLKRDFYLIVPFLSIMLEMLEGVPDIDLPLDRMGGLGDLHAGTNETSIMLAVDSRSVSKEYRSLSGYIPVRKTLLGRFLMLLGKRDIARALDWIGDSENPFYLGNPSMADSKSGEIMLTYHVRRSKQLLDEALSGRYNPPRRFKGFIKLLLKIFPEW